MAGDPEHITPCHFCGGPLPMWENVLVLQLAGVPAHVECPTDTLDARLAEVGPESTFPYREFSAAVDRRIDRAAPPTSRAGTIEC
jgi:hypothetical protein